MSASSFLIAPAPGGATIVGFQDSDTFDVQLSQDITLQNLEIRGNAASSFGFGVSIFTNAQANIFSCNIHDNPDGGVSADSSSQVALNNSILQNSSNGDGLDVTNDSTADMVSTTIQNNTGDGVHIQRISVGEFISANTIAGNGRASVSCDTTSLAAGDLSAFTKISCSQIERQLGPPRPGHAKQPNP